MSQLRPAPKRKRVRDPEYLRWLHDVPCPVCAHVGEKQTTRTEAHHVKTKGAGGGDDTAVACCVRHHKAFHMLGRKSFAARYGIDLMQVSAEMYAEFKRSGWAA